MVLRVSCGVLVSSPPCESGLRIGGAKTCFDFGLAVEPRAFDSDGGGGGGGGGGCSRGGSWVGGGGGGGS